MALAQRHLGRDEEVSECVFRCGGVESGEEGFPEPVSGAPEDLGR